jgi:ribosomal protein S7
LTKIELALEILHTRSKIAQDSQKKLTKHLKKETIEVTFNSKSIQLKTKKNSITGLTDALASVHPTLGGRTDAMSAYLLWMQAEVKSTQSIVPDEPMVSN